MKFKFVFVLFNIIIILSFLSLFFMPLFFLGFDSASLFWKENWFLVLLFLLLIGILNFYFITRWNLFTSLEKQDWPSLQTYLSKKIYTGGKLSDQNMRLYVNTCLAQSQMDKIEELRVWMTEKHGKQAARYADLLAVSLVMKGEGEALQGFLEAHSGESKNYWVKWLKGFAFYLQQKRDEAGAVFSHLAEDEKFRKNRVLALLNGYLLDSLRTDGENQDSWEERKQALAADVKNTDEWTQYLDRVRDDSVYHVLLDKMVADAREWALKES